MKRVLLLTAFFALTFNFAQAQYQIEDLTPQAPNAMLEDASITPRITAERDRGLDFFFEDFANGFDGNSGFGAIDFEDNGIEDIWRIGDDSETPLSPGQYSINSGTAATETAENGYALLDMDGYNTEYELYPGAPSISAYMTLPTMDMSSLESVILEWQSYFRYCCFPFSPMTVEVSNDGGDTWTLFEAHGDFTESANTASANGNTIKMDISCAAGGQSEVDIRFAYNSELADIFTDFGFAYSTYWWVIDDIAIYQNPVADDIQIEYVTNGDVFNVWEYRITPMEQAVSADDGGVLVGTVYRNLGSNDANDVTVTIEILNEAQDEVLSTTVSETFSIVSNLNSETCPQKFQDTLYMETGWEPEDTGKYWVRSTISVDGVSDEVPEDNMFEKIIVFSDDEYGHDDEDELDMQVRPSETSTGSGEFNPTGTGNFYHMVYENTVGYGVLLSFGPASDEGPDFEIRCYYYDNTVGINGSFYDETFYELPEAWIPQGVQELWVYLPFEDPIDMFADEAYFIAAVNDFIDSNEFAIRGQANSDSDNSTGQYNLNGDGDLTWFTSQSYSPAIRLITSERVGIDDIAIQEGILLEQNVPNPAIDQTTINFNLTWSRAVNFEIHDLSGRLIETVDMGTLVPGGHSLNLDLSGYQSGVYYYTITADEFQTTRKMIITAN